MATSDSVAAARAGYLGAWASAARRLCSRLPLPTIINIGVLLLLTSSAAQWTWRVVQPPVPTVPALTKGLDTKSDGFDLSGLLAANLFGETPSSAAPTPTAALTQIPESALDLVLTGIVAAGPDSLALIRVNDDPETPFALGDEITRGVSLRTVYADRAIIQRRGQTEALLLEDNSSGGGDVTLATPASAPENAAGIQPGNSENSFSVDRDFALDQMSNPDFLRQALIVPNAGGGFLVRQITPGSVYEKLGLRVGDVIRKVNGRTLNTMEDALRLYQQIGGVEKVNEVELEIMRGGQTEQLRYVVQ